MRPIDGDALKKDFPKDEDWEYPVNTNEYVCKCIDAQPTVDAIPVEWLEKLSMSAQSDEACEMINEIIARWEARGMAVLDHVPEGWEVVGGCTNAPAGYRFISNNKSRFGGEYQHALVKENIAIEWWCDNT